MAWARRLTPSDVNTIKTSTIKAIDNGLQHSEFKGTAVPDLAQWLWNLVESHIHQDPVVPLLGTTQTPQQSAALVYEYVSGSNEGFSVDDGWYEVARLYQIAALLYAAQTQAGVYLRTIDILQSRFNPHTQQTILYDLHHRITTNTQQANFTLKLFRLADALLDNQLELQSKRCGDFGL